MICGNVSRTIRESNNCSTYPVSNEIIYTCIPSEESDGPACKEEYLCEQFTKDKTQCYDLPTSGIKKLCIPNPQEGNNQSCIEKYLCENIISNIISNCFVQAKKGNKIVISQKKDVLLGMRDTRLEDEQELELFGDNETKSVCLISAKNEFDLVIDKPMYIAYKIGFKTYKKLKNIKNHIKN